MCSGDILSSLRAPKGTQQPQMCHLLSSRMGLIDFLGGVGFDIDYGHCIMILTILNHTWENAVFKGIF